MRMLIVLFYPRATEKTSLIYRILSKKDLKYIMCLIIMKFIASHLIRNIGLSVVEHDKIYTAKSRTKIELMSFQGCGSLCFAYTRVSAIGKDERGV